jgi:hypothetical protein
MSKKQYYIYDESANTGKPYIDENGNNTGIYENRALFSTYKRAEEYAKSFPSDKIWYSILKD